MKISFRTSVERTAAADYRFSALLLSQPADTEVNHHHRLDASEYKAMSQSSISSAFRAFFRRSCYTYLTYFSIVISTNSRVLSTMSVVAVAGGLGDVGRTIVEEILRGMKHKVYILTRKVQSK